MFSIPKPARKISVAQKADVFISSKSNRIRISDDTIRQFGLNPSNDVYAVLTGEMDETGTIVAHSGNLALHLTDEKSAGVFKLGKSQDYSNAGQLEIVSRVLGNIPQKEYVAVVRDQKGNPEMSGDEFVTEIATADADIQFNLGEQHDTDAGLFIMLEVNEYMSPADDRKFTVKPGRKSSVKDEYFTEAGV